MTWLDGFQKVTYAHTPGLAYTRPVRGIVFHTTEGGTESGAFSVYTRIQAAPHSTVNPETKTRYQHIDTDLGAYALRNLAGGVETNTSGVVQIELVGFAKDTEFWSTERLRWVGEEVVAPIMRAHPGIPNAVYGGSGRMSFQQWNDWAGGLCGHKDVPENDHCVTLETPILTADLDWVPAGQLVEGDELIAFDEEPAAVGSTVGRRFRSSIVTKNVPFKSTAMRVVTDRGDVVCTPDHPWLVELLDVKHGPQRAWVQTSDLDPARHRLYFACEPWQQDRSHAAGWLSGMMDADGYALHYERKGSYVGLGQLRGATWDRFIFECESRGFVLKTFERPEGRGFGTKAGFMEARLSGGLWEKLKFLGMIKPTRLNLRSSWDGAAVGKTTSKVAIRAIEKAGDVWMAGLTTSTKTYIANGFLVHNTDPGGLNLATILSYARGVLSPAGVFPESGDDMNVNDFAAAIGATVENGKVVVTLLGDPQYPGQPIAEVPRAKYPLADAIAWTHEEMKRKRLGY